MSYLSAVRVAKRNARVEGIAWYVYLPETCGVGYEVSRTQYAGTVAVVSSDGIVHWLAD